MLLPGFDEEGGERDRLDSLAETLSKRTNEHPGHATPRSAHHLVC